MTINELARDRRKAIANLKLGEREVDSQVELLERYLNRVKSRRNKIPDENDYTQIGNFISEIDRKLSNLVQIFANQAVIFY